MSKNQIYFKELEKLTLENIKNKIFILKKDIILLKIKQKTKQKIKSHLFKSKKHEIAQLRTIENIYINTKKDK